MVLEFRKVRVFTGVDESLILALMSGEDASDSTLRCTW